MNVLAHIEKAHFLVTADEIEKLAGIRFESQTQADRAQGAYFRVLLAATQKELQGRPTLRRSKSKTAAAALTETEIAEHLETFETVNALYYAAVIRGSVTPDVADSESLKPDERRERSLARNRRTNYARTAATALRNYIRAGLDVRALVVPTVTKGMLVAAASGTRPATDPVARAERAVARLMHQVESLGEGKAARELLQTLMTRTADLYTKVGGKITTKPAIALAEKRPLQTPQGTFFPAGVLQ